MARHDRRTADPTLRLAARLRGADLAAHLDLVGRPPTLQQLAEHIERLPHTYRAGLIAHLADRHTRNATVAGDTTAARVIDHIHTLIGADGGHTPDPDSDDGALLRDLIQLLDVTLRSAIGPAVVAAGTRLLGHHGGWLSPRTLTRLAAHTDPNVQRVLAHTAGSHDGVYQMLFEDGPHPARLHHLAHDRYRQRLSHPATPQIDGRGRRTNGSRGWYEQTTAGRRQRPAARRQWDHDSIARLAARLVELRNHNRQLHRWHSRLMAATADPSLPIEDVLTIDQNVPAGSLAGTVVCIDLHALLVCDQIDPDLATPVWAATAAERGSAQDVPLAQMSRASRTLVWNSVWDRWLQQADGARWPTWCPWPTSGSLEQAPASLLHGDLPHPEPARWLHQRLTVRISRQSGRTAATATVDDAYIQALQLSGTWDGTIASLLDACAATHTPPGRPRAC